MVVVGVWGCAPKPNPGNPTPKAESPSYVPEKNSFGLVSSEAWKDLYPNQYNSMQENNKNKWPEVNLNEHYPEMVTLGKGYGYAKFFTEAGGHTYSMYSVVNNGRISEKSKAQCLACKTPDIHKLVEEQGPDAWKLPFHETAAKCEDGISCSFCHQDEDPSQLGIIRKDWVRALGPNIDKRTTSSEVCGQCHCDYSMNPETGEPQSPYDDVTKMTPEESLKWYDEHGFADWVYPETGAKMIAVRHSEFEYVYGGEGNHMAKLGYDCADCHMPTQVDSEGKAYHSHFWQSPLENDELIKNDCSKCHKDLKAEMKAIQEEVDGRTHQIGMRAACFVQNFVKAVRDNSLNDEQLERLRTIQREATLYWNSAYAENSEGAHNKALYNHVLDLAEQLLDEADQILGVASTAEGFVSEYDPEKDYKFMMTAEEYYEKYNQR
ncbi:ammonia-forming cytochrome c nitrite reductase subunit c552 [Eggerthellaceae bacterium zg-1084]|uniref:nitrite reductase (cytochrome; ammonia-forming) n=2 Tax=Berryella wangjianweii TaxID=2734634 RepID=A0A6M8J9E3_9ACTN|nr:ammonia-forming cytochrome c nitrite reductase subunit c552 [Berryella wangjianweii]NPD32397.1 ammonia-forming cytochrome c nitrite reductase subunit c552 [Eggerthellaceae bacterium zg-997]QKF07959.1 ammonia-forming cytochrome c nitrite reductase subunit c552 [Berryella wangjianweii]